MGYKIVLSIAFCVMGFSAFGADAEKGPFLWSSRLKVYYTQWVNYPVKDDTYTNIAMMNEQKASTEPERTDFDFICPGNSLLVGMASKFVERPYDRHFRFICAFLDNDKGEPVKKNSCTPREKTYDNKGGDDMTFACTDNQAIHALSSAIHPDKDQDDRLYKPYCCKIEDGKKAPVAPMSSSCKESEGAGGDQNGFQFMCPTNQVMTKIRTIYSKAQQDRQFFFTCCTLN